MKKQPFYLNGVWTFSSETYLLRNPWNRRALATVCRAGAKHVEQAIRGAVRAFETTRKYSSFERAQILRKIASGLEKRKEEMARTLSLEAGKCLRHARAEVERSVSTFTLAAEEASRLEGEILPLDIVAGNKGRTALVRRFPVGPMAGISPFNFPLNLVAHKLAPAIAVGNPLVLKPATQTPLSALKLAEIAGAAGLVAGGFSVVTASSRDAAPLVEDPRIRKLTFTGSPVVGWEMKQRCGKKKITLELGGNAAAIVCKDADVKWALERCVMGGFAYQGQVCIHLQRLFVHESIYALFVRAYVRAVKKLKIGNPLFESTDIGPMIDLAEARRVEQWVEEAGDSGARILCGGNRRGSVYAPTLIENCGPRQKVSDEEVFGPVVVLYRYREFDDAIKRVNDSRFGLQTGLFTNDIRKIWKAFDEIETGGLVVNDVPTFRSDNQPYGGVKDSGFGREGVKYAIEEMTERKALSLNIR